MLARDEIQDDLFLQTFGDDYVRIIASIEKRMKDFGVSEDQFSKLQSLSNGIQTNRPDFNRKFMPKSGAELEP